MISLIVQDHNLIIMEKIYQLIDPITLEPRYVGYTYKPLGKRLGEHIRDSVRRGKTTKQRWIKSLLDLGQFPQIKAIKYLPKKRDKSWQYWETYFISLYRELGYNLTNSTDGGEGVPSPMPTLTKQKIGDSLRGKTGSSSRAAKPLIVYNDTEELFFYGAQEAIRYFAGRGIKMTFQNISQCLTGQLINGGRQKRTGVAGYKFKRP